MDFRLKGLSAAPFQHLFGLSKAVLARHGVRRCIADSTPGYPDRIELRDAEPGQSLLLINHIHQAADTPYRASHAIFVREGAEQAFDEINQIAPALRLRTLSLRAFDSEHMMLDADLVEGSDAEQLIQRLFENARVAYLQAHYARRGCFAAQIERV